MKKLWIAFVLGSGFLISACSEHDEAYYLKNIDAAIKKDAECEADLKAAILSRDEQKYKEFDQNQECKAARKALRKHKEEQREKERQAKEAERQAQVEQAKQKLQQEYASLDWQKVATAYTNSECAKKWIGEYSEDFECLAFKGIYDEKAEQAQAEMLKNNDFEQIQGLEKTYCSADKRKYSACDIWGVAAKQKAIEYFNAMSLDELSKTKKQYASWGGKVNNNISSAWREVDETKHKAKVEQYVKDTEALKQDYNQCVETLQPLKKANKWQQVSDVEDGYPCRQVEAARMKLGLDYGFKQKME